MCVPDAAEQHCVVTGGRCRPGPGPWLRCGVLRQSPISRGQRFRSLLRRRHRDCTVPSPPCLGCFSACVQSQNNVNLLHRFVCIGTILMDKPYNNFGLFHRRKQGRRNDIAPELIWRLRGEADPGHKSSRFSLVAVVAVAVICATIGILSFIAF